MIDDILEILPYGNSILKKKSENVEIGTDLKSLIKKMTITVENANGCGLAAPQIGKNINLFITDYANQKFVFINPEIQEYGEVCHAEEGCLSIPGLRFKIPRRSSVKIKYYDENWKKHEKDISGILARIILHEYDHLIGKLIIDYLPPLKKKIIEKKLFNIKKGKISIDYPMRF